MTFDQLSQSVTPSQKNILNAIWFYYLEKNQWPTIQVIHHEFGNPETPDTLGLLGGHVVRDQHDTGKRRYMLSLLGILLTDDGAKIEHYLENYLAVLYRKFRENPEGEPISAERLRLALMSKLKQFTKEEFFLLGKVVNIGNFLGYAGGTDSGWNANFPHDIDKWKATTDFKQYIHSKIMETYDPACPIDEGGRVMYETSFGTQEHEKEKDHRFHILLAKNQAKQDFDCWLGQLKDEGRRIAVIYADIDNFKALNTKYTNPKVDEGILRNVDKLFETISRSRGGAYLDGGDEYVIILPNHDASEAVSFAEKVRHAFEQHSFKIETDTIPITLSIGIALWPDHGSNYLELKTRACAAQILAKAKRNCAVMYKINKPTDVPLPRSGLTPLAQRLAVYLASNSKDALDHDPNVDPATLCKALNATEVNIGIAADELETNHWVILERNSDTGKAGFSSLWPMGILFRNVDPEIMGTNPIVDAKAIAGILVREDKQMFLREIDKELSWSPRRINPAVDYLLVQDVIQSSETLMSDPYIVEWIGPTISTHRFTKND